jgi:serine/threonine-protein kinase
VKQAQLLLQQQGLQTKLVQQASATVAPGLVISQNPGPGDRVAKETVVTLTVSSGKPRTTVPTVVGLPVGEAQSQLVNRGLKYTTHEVPSSTIAPGNVTASNPKAGTTIFEGDTVTLNVSTGPKTAGVPDVSGEPYENAVGALKGQGFKVARQDVANAAEEGTVIGQNPSAGTEAAVGSTVTLSVSKGPELVSVPAVSGDDQQTATQILQQQGLTVTVIQQDVTDPTQDGLVLAQDPAGGRVQQGSAVTITVGHLVTVPPPTTETTPTPGGTTTTDTTATTTDGSTTTPTDGGTTGGGTTGGVTTNPDGTPVSPSTGTSPTIP